MADVVIFPSVLGVRQGITDVADVLRGAGHETRVFDLWDGDVYDDYGPAMVRSESLDYAATIGHAIAQTADIASDPVVVGFSLGGALAEGYALQRRCAGVVLFAAAASLQWFDGAAWPGDTPVQIHYGLDDPFREEDELTAFTGQLRLAGARYEQFDYDLSGHLFTDASLPKEYDEAATELVWERMLPFVAGL